MTPSRQPTGPSRRYVNIISNHSPQIERLRAAGYYVEVQAFTVIICHGSGGVITSLSRSQPQRLDHIARQLLEQQPSN